MTGSQSLAAGGMMILAFAATIAGTRLYKSAAVRRGILANPNFRSLHEHPIPRGGGIVFSLVCVAAIIGLAAFMRVEESLMRALVLGGIAATVFGFIDDVRHIGAKTKICVQGILAAWTLICFGGHPLFDLPWTPTAVDLVLSWSGLVWMMNFYNFMDGIDGMAASGAVFISTAAIAVVIAAGSPGPIVAIFVLFAMCSVGFLVFNWPPASVFMGDSGSVFLGFCFGALIAATLASGQISRWTWLIIFGYFAIDPTTTTVLRIFLMRKWYGEHRSHAYQNLARLGGSHLRVLTGIWLYHVLWLLPLAVWSALAPSSAPVAGLLAVLPVVVLTLRYGPLLSRS